MKKCFVICPIGEEGSEARRLSDNALNYIIKPAFSNYDVIRADQIADNGMITQSIIENLLTADIAVADLSGQNPNVFYELAIRHSFGLPTIQITRDPLDSIPFDVSNVRTIQYNLEVDGADKAKEDIKKIIESIENGNTESQNPVTSVSKILSFSTGSENSNDSVLSELLLKVNNIPNDLERLENNIGTRFSQMLSAFSESIKQSGSAPKSQDDILNGFLAQMLSDMMVDPNSGVQKMTNLMNASKMLEENGLIEKKDQNV